MRERVMEPSDIKKILCMWLALPLTALDWWMAWSRLPERVVMKFGHNGQPTSWASRGDAMRFDLVFLACSLAFMTVIGFVVSSARPDRASRVAWGIMLCGGFVFLVLNGILWMYQVG